MKACQKEFNCSAPKVFLVVGLSNKRRFQTLRLALEIRQYVASAVTLLYCCQNLMRTWCRQHISWFPSRTLAWSGVGSAGLEMKLSWSRQIVCFYFFQLHLPSWKFPPSVDLLFLALEAYILQKKALKDLFRTQRAGLPDGGVDRASSSDAPGSNPPWFINWFLSQMPWSSPLCHDRWT